MEYRFFLALAPITVLLLIVVSALLWKFRTEPTARALGWYALLCIWLIVARGVVLEVLDEGWRQILLTKSIVHRDRSGAFYSS